MHIHILGGMDMQNTNEGIFICTYDSEVLRKRGKAKKNWKDKLYASITKHKFISLVILAFIMLSSINVIMIYNFFKILQNI